MNFLQTLKENFFPQEDPDLGSPPPRPTKVPVEYVWLDGYSDIQLRSKVRTLDSNKVSIDRVTGWSFDGSSTKQAPREESDLLLSPVKVVSHPLIDTNGSLLVMCQVMHTNMRPHSTNQRVHLINTCKEVKVSIQEPWFGVEQEYFVFKEGRPVGWLNHNGQVLVSPPQGEYYCGTDPKCIWPNYQDLHTIAMEHMQACLTAGLLYYGYNAEVCPAQWEYQVGPGAPLDIADTLWLSRFLLIRIANKYGYTISFHPKPVPRGHNGSGAHTNYSTRDSRTGDPKVIARYIKHMRDHHTTDIPFYGRDLSQRLVGECEASNYNEFSYDELDRGSSVRVPAGQTQGNFYLEDRRPGANMDPYMVFNRILDTTLLS